MLARNESWPFLNMLGELITLETVSPQTISKITMDIVLQLMGQPTEQQQQQQQQELLIACQLEFRKTTRIHVTRSSHRDF